MATLNIRARGPKTFEGSPAVPLTAEKELRRTVLCCLLWENQFYESGDSIANRIIGLIKRCSPAYVADLAIEARSKFNLRHVPLFLCRELARNGNLKADTLTKVIQRPDEITEFMAIYWDLGRCKIASQVKKGLANAFSKFNEYSFAKYNRPKAIKLRDVMFMVHPKPSKDKEELYKKIADNTLATPDTWEVALSGGANKRETWTRLLEEKKLGALALLRNLRNMQYVGVDRSVIRHAIKTMNTNRLLPFRFIAAARHNPSLSYEIESAMLNSLSDHTKLTGKTVILVDNSWSMYGTKVSEKSELDRSDAACALAILLREICDDVLIMAFSDNVTIVPNYQGLALGTAIKNTGKNGTRLGNAVDNANNLGYDRVIVITDEQSADRVGSPLAGKPAYMINVAAYQNSVGFGAWTRIEGWSESIVDFIVEAEK